jgi:hypothetical protein
VFVMAIRFEDTPAPKAKAAEKPVEKARPIRSEEKAAPDEAAPATKDAGKARRGPKARKA